MTKSGNNNAKSHGAYAQIIPPSKKNRKFEKLRRKLVQHFMPTGPLQRAIVGDLATTWWHKRKFDRWHDREFSTLLNDLNADEQVQSDLREPDDVLEKIADLERAFNEKAIQLGKRVIVAKGKRAERLLAEIAELEQARSGALAPLHASRERQRLEREDAPKLRNFERLEKAQASMDTRFDRGLRRLAMAKTFDELHASKLLEHRPTKSPIIATAERTKAKSSTESNLDDRNNDDKKQREIEEVRRSAKKLKDVDFDTSFAPYQIKKTTKADQGDDW